MKKYENQRMNKIYRIDKEYINYLSFIMKKLLLSVGDIHIQLLLSSLSLNNMTLKKIKYLYKHCKRFKSYWINCS